MLEAVSGTALRAAYQAQQASFRIPLLLAQRAVRGLAGPDAAPPARARRALERRYDRLLEDDLANVRRGLYPASLLFQIPLLGYAARLPRFLLDMPWTIRRIRRDDFQELPEDLDPRRYPAYFRRNFHWQTDGYLSRHSAEIYDLGVEILFLGCADVMRRQLLPPIVRFARKQSRGPLRILDVGCGTGRTLAQLAAALPGHQYFGVDLSPFYLETARENLAHVPEVSLVCENAEKLPYRDGYFDVVSSVYLFHELPGPARRKVLAEMTRVLRPGGLLVIEDSAQLSEAKELEIFLRAFPEQMHEPFYNDYLADDLSALVEEAGFPRPRMRRAWLSKVVSTSLPA